MIPRLAGTVVAILIVVVIVVASHVPMGVHTAPTAVLRLALTARPERVEICREVSEEALASVPQHMRQAVVCEGRAASYRLEVRKEDSLVLSVVVRGGGLRQDRQLYVFREIILPSGLSTIDVRLSRIDTLSGPTDPDTTRTGGNGAAVVDTTGRLRREIEERQRRMGDEVPPELALRASVSLAPREVLLVTYDRDARSLVTVRDQR
jgi:hypothetical protein